MWRQTYACAGTIVADDLAADEFFGDCARVFDVDRDRAAAPRRVFRTRDLKARRFRQLDQVVRLPDALRANLFDADLVDDLIATACGVERGDGGRAVQEARDAGRVSQLVGEGERRFVRHPAGDFRFETFVPARMHVEITRAGAAAEPLDRATRRKINVQLRDRE